VKERYLILAF